MSRTSQVALGLVWAQAKDGAIGAAGALPWHLPEDLAHFRRTTAGAPVIMGRATWESLPERFRPLPGRANIVLSRQPDYAARGAHLVGGLDEALVVASQDPDVERAWVIGGAQVYAAAIERADLLVVTYVDVQVEGDAFAPPVGPGWTALASPPGPTGALPDVDGGVSTSGLHYRFVTYRRSDAGAPPAQDRSGSTSVV
ncbi:dihydrofolate reductase [Sanguibacter antarcticus]|uniref:dihydrofolate reductase n=1 Tax=Sanguibacter antarcticus TaxID=372484 RepID=A0A2A9E3J5_9MICO|nr:dihydrofolate reductase [Sanguibacter antarcticus]PFG33518.1 dihydrofolate reductase [Sanguibacter antarcticus]